MNLLPPKKPEGAEHVFLSWHPNFRNYERLPDIKVVRTAFFINTTAVTIAVLMLSFVLFKEYQLNSLHKQIEDAQRRVSHDSSGSTKAVQLYRKFQAADKQLQSIANFRAAAPVPSPIILRINDTLPSYIAVTLLDFKEKGLTVRGIVRGAPELAAGRANAYVETLRKDKEMMTYFDAVSLDNMSPNPLDGRLILELSLKYKAPKK